MRFLIITGLSGAGKTQVVHCLEDMGYYCIDNMPPLFLTSFAQVCYSRTNKVENVAIVMDIRGGEMFDDIEKELDRLKDEGFKYEIVFLEAEDEVLVTRYKESRRVHPLAPGGHIIDGIKMERERLRSLRAKADHIIDTSYLLTRNLKEFLRSKFGEDSQDYFVFNIQSFGFKYGLPSDSDLVLDVRFLPNPFYIDHLKALTGKDVEVRDFVMGFAQSKMFLEKASDMIKSFAPYYMEEGKQQLVVAIGCTGGKHRSVAIAEKLGKRLSRSGYKVTVGHRDIEKDAKRD